MNTNLNFSTRESDLLKIHLLILSYQLLKVAIVHTLHGGVLSSCSSVNTGNQSDTNPLHLQHTGEPFATTLQFVYVLSQLEVHI